MKKTNDLPEMKYIKDWCITILEFMAMKSSGLKPFYEVTKDNLLKNYTKNNKNILKGFKEGYRDINEMAKNLPNDDYLELNKVLVSKFGKSLEDINKKEFSKLDKVIKRGEILNDNEYRLLEDRANEISQSTRQSPEIKTINELLMNYYQKKR